MARRDVALRRRVSLPGERRALGGFAVRIGMSSVGQSKLGALAWLAATAAPATTALWGL